MSSAAPPERQRKPQDSCFSEEEINGFRIASHLGIRWGLINPGWVTRRKVYDVERPERLDDPRNITGGVSRLRLHQMYNSQKFVISLSVPISNTVIFQSILDYITVCVLDYIRQHYLSSGLGVEHASISTLTPVSL